MAGALPTPGSPACVSSLKKQDAAWKSILQNGVGAVVLGKGDARRGWGDPEGFL